MDLLSAFRKLPRPDSATGGDTFSVSAAAEGSPHRIGKDSNGAPALLIRVAGSEGAVPGPVVLRHVSVQHDVRCRISSNVRPSADENLTILRCISGEPTLREYFVRVLEVAAKRLGQNPTALGVNQTLKRLVELFRAFELPARLTVQGLWAELFVVAYALEPPLAVRAWHADPDEGFDFSDGPNRLEVKSFSGDARVHHFSLRQVRPGPGVGAMIASLRVERAVGGASILDLLQVLATKVSAELLANASEVVAMSLGESAAAGLCLAFDVERARSSLRFFECKCVPAIDPPLPTGVLSVRLEALLDESKSTSASSLRERGAFFSAFVPRT